MNSVVVALANYPILFHATLSEWAKHIEDWVEEACFKGAELLVFPEYGSMVLSSCLPIEHRGNLNNELKQLQQFLPYFKSHFEALSQRYSCVIVSPSFPEYIGNRYVNRCYVFGPGGSGYQDKFHMTRFEDEVWGISSGERRLRLFEYNGILFGIQICYDVEFSVSSVLLGSKNCQLILAPSCTETLHGASRVHIGARARALEQQLYVGVSQTIGNADWSEAVDVNYGYCGFYSTPDRGFDAEGIVKIGTHNSAGWLIEELQLDLLEEVRKNGQVLNHRDHSSYLAPFSIPIDLIKLDK